MARSDDGADLRTHLPWRPRPPHQGDRELDGELLRSSFVGLHRFSDGLPPTLSECLEEVLEKMAERSPGPESLFLSDRGTPAYTMLAWLAESLGDRDLPADAVTAAADAMLLTYLSVRCQDDLVDEAWADPVWTYLAETLMAHAVQLEAQLSGDPTTFLEAWERQVLEFSEAGARDARWRATTDAVWDADAIRLQGYKFLPMAGPLTALLIRAGRAQDVAALVETVTVLGVGLQLTNDLLWAAPDLENGLGSPFLARMGLVPGRDGPAEVRAAFREGMADERMARYFAMIVAAYRSSLQPLAHLSGDRLARHVDLRIVAITEEMVARGARAVLSPEDEP